MPWVPLVRRLARPGRDFGVIFEILFLWTHSSTRTAAGRATFGRCCERAAAIPRRDGS